MSERDCEHGSLRRSCEHCDAAARIAALEAELAARTTERDEARQVVRDTLWMAGRYADGRRTYAVGRYQRALATARAGGYDERAEDAMDGDFDDAPTKIAQARTEGERTGRVQAFKEAAEMARAYEPREDDDHDQWQAGYACACDTIAEMLDDAASTPTPPPQEDR